MGKKYFILKNMAWFCISLYYSRKEWGRLLREVQTFYENKKPLFEHYIIQLSEENGEHIQLALSLSSESNLEAIQKQTDIYFRAFMSSYPSTEPKPFRYGARIWGNYTNNSVEWNRFEFKRVRYSHFLDFSQTSSDLLIDFLKDDFSEVNAFTMALFMCTKALRIFSETGDEKPDVLIYHALKGFAVEVLEQSHVTGFNLREKLNLYGIDYTEIMEATGQYWHYGDEDAGGSAATYRHWVEELRKIATVNPDSYFLINRYLWDIFDVSDTLKLLIMYLLKAYQIQLSNNG